MSETCSIETQIQMVDGTIHTFCQTDPEANRGFLERFVPAKLYSSPYFAIEDALGISVFKTSKIEVMDMQIDPAPRWPGLQEGARVREISRTEFDRILGGAEGAEIKRQARTPGEDFKGYVVMTFDSGKELILETQTKVALIHDQKHALNKILDMPTICLPINENRFLLINGANLLHLRITPGQPNIAPTAWRAEPSAVAEDFI
ncbi:MAG: hypothetical protein ABFD69_06055 [Candidatus Sumerlaeia bacterium]